MITNFGKQLRKLRIDHGEILKDMAEKLQVSSSFLSSIEVGKRKVPNGMVERISQLYKLATKEERRLNVLAAEAVPSLKINISTTDGVKRQAALTFARSFNDLSDEDADEIIMILKNRSNRREE
jgi:transcriptional regulator with XRE-family HTH domain